jgi:hypothetical protein
MGKPLSDHSTKMTFSELFENAGQPGFPKKNCRENIFRVDKKISDSFKKR